MDNLWIIYDNLRLCKNKIYVYKKSKTLPKFVVQYLAKTVHTKAVAIILCDILACFGG